MRGATDVGEAATARSIAALTSSGPMAGVGKELRLGEQHLHILRILREDVVIALLRVFRLALLHIEQSKVSRGRKVTRLE